MTLAPPPELLYAPELAVLSVLDTTLQQTVYALFAAHPELLNHDTLEYVHGTAALWTADAIYGQISALQHSIERYRQAVRATQELHSLSHED